MSVFNGTHLRSENTSSAIPVAKWCSGIRSSFELSLERKYVNIILTICFCFSIIREPSFLLHSKNWLWLIKVGRSNHRILCLSCPVFDVLHVLAKKRHVSCEFIVIGANFIHVTWYSYVTDDWWMNVMWWDMLTSDWSDKLEKFYSDFVLIGHTGTKNKGWLKCAYKRQQVICSMFWRTVISSYDLNHVHLQKW